VEVARIGGQLWLAFLETKATRRNWSAN